MPLPSGFAPSLSLGFGGGPSQAIGYGAPNVANALTGAFSVGRGSATQTNSLPVTNTNAPAETPGPFNAAGLLGNNQLLLAAGLVAVAFFFKRKK